MPIAEDPTQREIEIANLIMQDLAHPFMVTFFGAFNKDDLTLSLVIEYCPGGDLLKYIKDRRDGMHAYTPGDRALVWIGQIFLALEFMHLSSPSMLMRDVKPGNVV